MNVFAHIATDVLAGRPKIALRRVRRRAIVYTIVSVFGLTAYSAGLVALGFALVPVFGPTGAALVIASGALLAAVLLVAGLLIFEMRTRRSTARSGRALAARAAVSLAPRLIKSTSPLTLLIVGGLGYLAANQLLEAPNDD